MVVIKHCRVVINRSLGVTKPSTVVTNPREVVQKQVMR